MKVFIPLFLLMTAISAIAAEPCPEKDALKAAIKENSVINKYLVRGSMKFNVTGHNQNTLDRGVIRTYKLNISGNIMESADYVVVDSACNVIPNFGGGGKLKPVPIKLLK